MEFSKELLQALHLLTRGGDLNQDARRKLKQVEHLLGFFRPALEELKKDERKLQLCDLGSGKSYLGFLLYEAFLKEWPTATLYSVEQRKELIESCEKIASHQGYSRMKFCLSNIQDSLTQLPEKLDFLVALHACDTATDDAIHVALKKKVRFVFLVPCCQAECSRELGKISTSEPRALSLLSRQPLHSRLFGSHLTNVFRTLYLEAHGYKVRVTEFTGWEHSQKNELIFAEKIQHQNTKAKKDLDALRLLFPVQLRLFSDMGKL